MIQSQMIQREDNTKRKHLYIAFELSDTMWKLAFGNGFTKREKPIAARNLDVLNAEIAKARKHFGMEEDVEIYSCYEAGRDGFWLHRYLTRCGIKNVVVDSASIEVNRRYRRVKTDRIDAGKLLQMLVRDVAGERKVWSVVRVPEADQEDARRMNRERERLLKERTGHTNRIKSLLILHGIVMNITKRFKEALENVSLWDGSKLPENITKELCREYDRYAIIKEQLSAMEKEQKEQARSGDKKLQQIEELKKLKSIGTVSSRQLILEYFGWRIFSNVKEVGAASGLAPTPYSSGNSQIEQGISKAGNRRVRKLMIELAWFWLRYQVKSELTIWFMKRFAYGGKRMRRIGIVALARKLLIALWKYLEKGIVPAGAELKA
jgi:transposase